MPMSLSEAIAYVDRGIARAKGLGIRLSFAVVDEYGQLVQLDRMDGAALMSPDLAQAKALTAVNFKLPTSEVKKLDRETLRSIEEAVHFKVLALPGGVPIFEGGALRGALGVSGATAHQEEDVAAYALKK
jgi:glc operon protein GlcG